MQKDAKRLGDLIVQRMFSIGIALIFLVGILSGRDYYASAFGWLGVVIYSAMVCILGVIHFERLRRAWLAMWRLDPEAEEEP